ncbi:MAG: 6-carboxytetrahydropterin synthase [Ectothiorhodospiraceae bacterium]|nr:6-carboxytetrahydropterin synthase [Ectothiorhodospiraceae bacterium]
MTHRISRRIEIDAAHRIPEHGSRCRHLHGHRYVVEALAESVTLVDAGVQRGMVLDFSFLKELMIAEIDRPCDHGMMLWVEDHQVLDRLAPERAGEQWQQSLRDVVAEQGYCETCDNALGTRLYLLPEPPTAEVLAEHWFARLAPGVRDRSHGRARLVRVTVWETPNCRAEFEPAAER